MISKIFAIGDEKDRYETMVDDKIMSLLEELVPEESEFQKLNFDTIIESIKTFAIAVVRNYTDRVYEPTTFTVEENSYYTRFPYSIKKAVSCDIV